MKKIHSFFFFLFLIHTLHAQISICSWNLQDFGKSKSDSAIDFIANTVKGYDVIALQEVVAGDGGIQTVAKLSDALNRRGTKWQYSVSNPTVSSSYKTERYAFIWKTAKLTIIGKAWLEQKYKIEIDREPFFATFKYDDKVFTIVNFHAITKANQPETEVKYFKYLPAEYPGKHLIFCGDFNLPQSHTVFNPLRSMGYKPVLTGQKTSLKEACIHNECLASEFDNMFYDTSTVTFVRSGVLLFYKNFSTLKEASKISDHIPIYFQFTLK